MVHCIHLGITGYDLKKNCITFNCFVIANSADPDGMSSLFTKGPIKEFLVHKGLSSTHAH